MRKNDGMEDQGREIDDDTDVGWDETLQEALVTGSIVCIVTLAAVALRGRADSGSAVAPINATSHVLYGPEAAEAEVADVKHTLPGLAINAGASVFWAAVYERLFRPAVKRGDIGRSILGGPLVAALAWLVDYRLVPNRLTPGWEARVSGRSLAAIFGAMALGLSMRNMLKCVNASMLPTRAYAEEP